MRAPRSASSIWSCVHASAGSRSSAVARRGEHGAGVGRKAGEGVVVVREARGIREQEAEHAGRLAEQADALLHERRGLDEHAPPARRVIGVSTAPAACEVRHGAGGELADAEQADVVAVDRLGLLQVEARRVRVDVLDVERRRRTPRGVNTSRSAEKPQPSSAR